MVARWRNAAVIFLVAMGVACGGGRGCGQGESSKSSGSAAAPPRPPATPGPPPTGAAVVPQDAVLPFGLTWYIGYPDNVSRGELERWYGRMVALSNNLWNVSEGQIYLARVVISDAVAPGTTANGLFQGSGPPAAATLDMLVYPGASWDVQAGGFVAYDGVGRENRICALPADADDLPIVHEASHLMFRLSWAPGPLLWDEYEDGFQDADCIMETTGMFRWCADDNHVAQASQPTSCWRQILADYPQFTFAGRHTAETQAPPLTVEYNDAP